MTAPSPAGPKRALAEEIRMYADAHGAWLSGDLAAHLADKVVSPAITQCEAAAKAWEQNYDGMFWRWAECDTERLALKEQLLAARLRLRILTGTPLAADATDDLAAYVAAAVETARREGAGLHHDLVSRLGFGNNITEPMADDDTIVEWFEERGREADEWRESQRWRDECHLAGHPEDEDCLICDPLEVARREGAETALRDVPRCGWHFDRYPDTCWWCRTSRARADALHAATEGER